MVSVVLTASPLSYPLCSLHLVTSYLVPYIFPSVPADYGSNLYISKRTNLKRRQFRAQILLKLCGKALGEKNGYSAANLPVAIGLESEMTGIQ
jgi:hypothetical protein